MSEGAGPPDVVHVTIDGRMVEVTPGTLIVEAARQAGVHIPVFCYHPRLRPAGVCRMCLVKVDKQPKLVTACTTPVTDGMVVHTRHPEVQEAQRSVLEFLLLNHPLDCPVCDKGGECELQDLTLKYGQGRSRLADPKERRAKAVELGPFVVLDEERCILCRRCVRFDDEIAREHQLVVAERAFHAHVSTAGGRPYAHPFTGNTVELCPVGALTSTAYRFRARPWDLASVASRCTLCSVQCAARLDVRHGRVVRVVSPGALDERLFGTPGLMAAYHSPAEDVPGARGMAWLCDRGRFNHGWLDTEERLAQPLSGRGPRKREISWEEALDSVAEALAEATRERGAAGVGILGGGRLFAEEALRLRALADALGSPHRDHRVARQAVASLATPGGRTGRPEDLEGAAAVVLVGQPLVERAPVLDLAVRGAAASGARLFAVGPVRPAYRFEFEWERAFPEEMAAALESIRSDVLRSADGRGRTTVALVWDGDGAWDGGAASAGRGVSSLAGWLESRGLRVAVLVPGAQPNARAAEAAGLLPGPGGGLDTAGILRSAAEGKLQVLYLVGANLLSTFPDREMVAAALERTPTVVVQDIFLTATARAASIVLPAQPAAMRGGTLVGMGGELRRLDPALPGDGRGRPDGEILAELLRRLGGDVPPGGVAGAWEDPVPALPVERAEELWAPGGTVPRRRPSRTEGLRLVVLERIHAGGGTAEADPFYCSRRESLAVHLHPQDAARLGLMPGMPIVIATAHGRLEAPVVVDPAMGEGICGVAAGGAAGAAWGLVRWDDPHPVVTSVQAVAAGVVS